MTKFLENVSIDGSVDLTKDLTVSGKVGIGTTSPLEKLHVQDGTDTFKYSSNLLNGFDGIELTGGAPTLKLVGTGKPWHIASLSDSLRIWDGGTYRFTLDNTGNVGIGTSTPTEKLDVNGNLKITGLSNQAGIYSIENGVIRVVNPKGASANLGNGNITGAIKIKLPTTVYRSDDMIRFTVEIFEYNTDESFTLLVGGYNNGIGGWMYPFAQILGSKEDRDIQVRFGEDGTSNCIWIGELNSSWQYPQVAVTNFIQGFSTVRKEWAEGWNISLVTAFDTVQVTKTNNFIWGDWNKLKGKPGNIAIGDFLPRDGSLPMTGILNSTNAGATVWGSSGNTSVAYRTEMGTDGSGYWLWSGGTGTDFKVGFQAIGNSNLSRLYQGSTYIEFQSDSILAGAFKKKNSSDSYMLLGGGGHKLLSDFSLSGHNHDTTYESKDASIWKYRGIVSTTGSFYDDANLDTRVITNGSHRINYTGASGHLIVSDAGGSASIVQIGAMYTEDYRIRNRTDGATWKPWRKIWHDGNLTPGDYLKRDGSLPMTGDLHLDTGKIYSSNFTTTNKQLLATQGGQLYLGNPQLSNIYIEGADVRVSKLINTNSSDSYMLLGGGGTKLLSDFQTAGNYLTQETDTLQSVTDRGNTTTNSITIIKTSPNRTSVTDNLFLKSIATGGAPYSGHGQAIAFYDRTYSSSTEKVLSRIYSVANDHSTSTAGTSLVFQTLTDVADATPTTKMKIGYDGTTNFYGHITIGTQGDGNKLYFGDPANNRHLFRQGNDIKWINDGVNPRTIYHTGNLPTYDNYQSWNLKTNGVQRTTVQSGGTLDINQGNGISTSYNAGGVVNISANFAGNGTANTVSRSDHHHKKTIITSTTPSANIAPTPAGALASWYDCAGDNQTFLVPSGSGFIAGDEIEGINTSTTNLMVEGYNGITLLIPDGYLSEVVPNGTFGIIFKTATTAYLVGALASDGSTGGTPVTYEAETTAFMTDPDVNIPNNSTLYYAGTAYETTGAALWTAIDAFIVREKAAGRWTKHTAIKPKIGSTALSQAVDLKDPSVKRGTYYGSWIHSGAGAKGNGTNTYFNSNSGVVDQNLTYTIIVNEITIGTANACSFGNWQGGSDTHFSLYEKFSGQTNPYVSMRDYGFLATDANRVGIKSIVNDTATTNNLRFYRNGVAAGATTEANSIPAGPIFEGCNYNYNAPQYYLQGTIATTIISSALTASEISGLHTSLSTLESDLKRKTWT